MEAESKIFLFDLGGVLYDIDKNKFEKTFFDNLYYDISKEYVLLDNVFIQYELGEISTDEFISLLKVKYFPHKSRNEIINIWNSILLGNNKDSEKVINLLTKLGYKIALLSNTNELHYNELYKTANIFLDKIENKFLSYKMGLRKPDLEAYKCVIKCLKARPYDIIFIDDSIENVNGAKKLGITALHFSGELYPFVEDVLFKLSK